MKIKYINRLERIAMIGNDRLLITPFLSWNNNYKFKVIINDKNYNPDILKKTEKFCIYENGYIISGSNEQLESNLQKFLNTYQSLE